MGPGGVLRAGSRRGCGGRGRKCYALRMWWKRRILTGAALRERAQELGVSTSDEDGGYEPLGGKLIPQAQAYEIQRRVLDAERHLRERRLFMLTLGSVALGAIVGIGSLLATIRNGNQQTENARRLLSVQLAREFRDGFDSGAMQQHRAKTAFARLHGADPPTDSVLDFFETMGHYVRQGALDKETVWNDFGYTVTRYWPAVRSYAVADRTGPNGGPDDYVNFEWLNGALLQDAARRRHVAVTEVTPGMDDVKEFLEDEAELLKPEKPTPPRKVHRGQPRG